MEFLLMLFILTFLLMHDFSIEAYDNPETIYVQRQLNLKKQHENNEIMAFKKGTEEQKLIAICNEVINRGNWSEKVYQYDVEIKDMLVCSRNVPEAFKFFVHGVLKCIPPTDMYNVPLFVIRGSNNRYYLLRDQAIGSENEHLLLDYYFGEYRPDAAAGTSASDK